MWLETSEQGDPGGVGAKQMARTGPYKVRTSAFTRKLLEDWELGSGKSHILQAECFRLCHKQKPSLTEPVPSNAPFFFFFLFLPQLSE